MFNTVARQVSTEIKVQRTSLEVCWQSSPAGVFVHSSPIRKERIGSADGFVVQPMFAADATVAADTYLASAKCCLLSHSSGHPISLPPLSVSNSHLILLALTRPPPLRRVTRNASRLSTMIVCHVTCEQHQDQSFGHRLRLMISDDGSMSHLSLLIGCFWRGGVLV